MKKEKHGFRVPRSVDFSPRTKPEIDQDSPSRKGSALHREALADYNTIGLAQFNRNPSHYLFGTKSIPLAIKRYGRVIGVYADISTYNELLLRIRTLRASVSRLQQMLEIANPGLLKRFRDDPNPTDVIPLSDLPRWPIMKSMPRQEPKSRFEGAWLRLEAEAAAEEMARIAGNYRLPDPDSDEDWGKRAVIADLASRREYSGDGEDGRGVAENNTWDW
jgi:hypothetical protein